MSKESGLGARMLVGGYDLSGDVASLSRISGGPAFLDVTAINASAHERIGGKRDGAMDVTAYFNPTAAQAHPVLSALPTADTMGTYCHRATIGSPAACINAKQANYDPTRGQDGALTFGVQLLANAYGLEWGTMLTASLRTDTGATNGASVDLGTGSTTYGLQAYLHVTAFAGTDATITIEESSDDGAGDAFAAVTGGAFTQVTSGPTWERIATSNAQTVERYLRVATSTSGGFTSLSFLVVVMRNDTQILF
jgi:hypothetical protein